MPASFSTNVTSKDIEFLSDKSVAIKDIGLLNTFVHSAPHAIEKLAKHVALISIDDVSVDSAGRIIIENPRFVEALRGSVKKAAAGDSNTICKNAYQCHDK